MNTIEKNFDAVSFFRNIKERMAYATEGMNLQEKKFFWKQLREGRLQLA